MSTYRDVSPQSAYHDVSPQRMREIMGNFCSGVTVITAASNAGPVGFTCQSFTSLSLEPPLITFNPSRSSTTWPVIRNIGTFCVNVLPTEHRHISGQFARSGTEKFAGISHSTSDLGSPILDDALAWIDCTLHAEHDGGDHTIVVGQVEAMHARDGADPLLFFRGNYVDIQRAQ